MNDFRHLQGQNDEWIAVQKTLPASATPSNDEEIMKLRDAANSNREQAARVAMQSLAPKLLIRDYAIPARDGEEVHARTYMPRASTYKTSPVYVHLHGGGFLFGTLNTEDATCARIALDANVVVLHVCYRHTPEYRFPTAWNDVDDAVEWLSINAEAIGGDREQVVIGGISAGAWLTASSLLSNAKTVGLHIVGQVLMIPCLVFHKCYTPQLAKLEDPCFSSYVQNRDAPILPMQRVELFSDLLQISEPRDDDLRLNPGNASSAQVKHLPPTTFGIAGLDLLRDEALLYAKLLHEAG
ncbi:hypothetical protein NU219Hw_g1523t1 [Hortaea werneckii]